MQGALRLGGFLTAAVANHSAALVQAEVEGQQGAMLHADGPQSGAVDLQRQQQKSCSYKEFM